MTTSLRGASSAPNPLGRYRDAIFFASGFAGLIYESIWTHYLKLFLGHAAYAQTLVLAIFMGGMAIGAALTARYTSHIRDPLRAYALVEAAIGALAVLFHPVYDAATGAFYDAAFNLHWDGVAFITLKWALATSLILPQSILLGATFPLFASAQTRSAPATEGRSIATLYFANSFGGAVGVLISGFILVPSLGLLGTMASAGMLNFAIAAVVMALSKAMASADSAAVADAASSAVADVARPLGNAAPEAVVNTAPARVVNAPSAAVVKSSPPVQLPRSAAKRTPVKRRGGEAAAKHAGHRATSPTPAESSPALIRPPREVVIRMVLAVAFFTGASSFVYEIGWIRMLSLVLGSATHSFELMLSSFVLGLALGGLWIRKRIDTAARPGVVLGYVQIAMGAAALATIPLHSLSFDLVAATLPSLPKTDAGYMLFNLLRYGIASLIMFPAAFCAGMTLPLVTHLLYRTASQGERAIGIAYSMNTVGAIVGLAFAVHIGLPAFGLQYLVASGALIDVLLGALLLAVFAVETQHKLAYAAVLASIGATFAVAQTFDPQKLASGVFRSGKAYARGTVLEVAHGKTATISVEKDRDLVSIKTNGKTDAAANLNPATHFAPDQLTMALIGAVPLLVHDSPRHVANIGFGSGLTSTIILADPRVLHLDTIEIEPKMVDLARQFDPLNRSVYTDARSAIRIEDAKSFFAANGKTYDIIFSEPSNPWVSGVSGLFSVEFYKHVARYLNDDGLFVQWLQSYETHPDRIVSVLKAMSEAFGDYMVVTIDDGDILLVGKPRGTATMPASGYSKLSPEIKAQLRGLEMANQGDITLRVVGNKKMFQPWLNEQPIPANSDFRPYLDSHADKDRFFSRGWGELVDVALSPIPIAEVLGGRPPLPTPSALSITPHFGQDPPWAAARMVWEILLGPMPEPNAFAIPTGLPSHLAGQGSSIVEGCAQQQSGDLTAMALRLATRVLPFISPKEGRDVLGALDKHDCVSILVGPRARWRALLDAVAARDAETFGAVADEMLTAGQGTTVVKTRYLLVMAMLGRIHAGKPDRARALWTQFSPRVIADHPPDLVLQLVHAHAFANGKQR